LHAVASAHNSFYSTSTGCSPFFTLHGLNFVHPFETALHDHDQSETDTVSPPGLQFLEDRLKVIRSIVSQNAREARQKSAETKSKGLENHSFQVGDRVFVDRQLLASKLGGLKHSVRFAGPLLITEIRGNLCKLTSIYKGKTFKNYINVSHLQTLKDQSRDVLYNRLNPSGTQQPSDAPSTQPTVQTALGFSHSNSINPSIGQVTKLATLAHDRASDAPDRNAISIIAETRCIPPQKMNNDSPLSALQNRRENTHDSQYTKIRNESIRPILRETSIHEHQLGSDRHEIRKNEAIRNGSYATATSVDGKVSQMANSHCRTQNCDCRHSAIGDRFTHASGGTETLCWRNCALCPWNQCDAQTDATQLASLSCNSKTPHTLVVDDDQSTKIKSYLKHALPEANVEDTAENITQQADSLRSSTNKDMITDKHESNLREHSYRVVNLATKSDSIDHNIVRVTARKISKSKASYKVKLTDGSFMWTCPDKIPPQLLSDFLVKRHQKRKNLRKSSRL
jgi:hypothetical protein